VALPLAARRFIKYFKCKIRIKKNVSYNGINEIIVEGMGESVAFYATSDAGREQKGGV
jgi:hypothetical protein